MQRNLLKHLSKGNTVTEAALLAGYSDKCPSQGGTQALNAIRRKMPELLDRAGLTDECLIKKYLKPGLNAMETKLAQQDGKFTDQVDLVAWGARRDYLDMTFKLKGSYAPTKVAGDESSPVKIIFDVFGDPPSDPPPSE